MKKTYVLLTGAKKNAGDYLITEKCKQLIKEVKPEFELIQLERWKNLESHLEVINSSKGIILMGGPGFTADMYPNVYKLVDDLTKIKVPITPMAVGWNTYPGDFNSMINFKFTEKSMALLKYMSASSKYLSCRDFYTHSILQKHNIKNSLMTGCASWYNTELIGEKMKIQKAPKVIAFTPAQDVRYSDITIKTMQKIPAIFPDAKIICSFHRGIGEADEFTSKNDAKNTKKIASVAQSLNMEIVDLSFNYENYKAYDNVDFHVGFRLHAHLYFLAKRHPSLLIHEDGRGKSMSETLGVYGVDAFKTGLFNKQFNIINKIFGKLAIPYSIAHDVISEVPDIVEHMLINHLENSFKGYAGVADVIDANYDRMKTFIMSLPND